MADKEKALYRRSARGFEPANDLAQEFWADVKIDDLVELKGSRPRNAAFHDLWWAMLSDMSKHSTPPMAARVLHEAAKTGTGINKVKKVISPKTGEAVWITLPGHTNFAAMDQVQFQRWVREAAAFLCANFLPGIVPDHFIREFEQLAI